MAQSNPWQHGLAQMLLEQLGAGHGAVAADIWEQKYAQKDGPNVIAYMREVSAVLQLNASQRNDLRAVVHRARTAAPSASSDLRAGRAVAAALLTAVRSKLTSQSDCPSSEFINALGQQLSGASGMQEMAAPCLGWFVQGGDLPDLNERDLADLVHGVYVALCQVLGPVAADRVFHFAVAKASRLPEAEEFPAERLIYTGPVPGLG